MSILRLAQGFYLLLAQVGLVRKSEDRMNFLKSVLFGERVYATPGRFPAEVGVNQHGTTLTTYSTRTYYIGSENHRRLITVSTISEMGYEKEA